MSYLVVYWESWNPYDIAIEVNDTLEEARKSYKNIKDCKKYLCEILEGDDSER
ncbi:MAG: hypothetical protein PVF58_14135 [Candidatus Methanofastidiosia archaeon]